MTIQNQYFPPKAFHPGVVLAEKLAEMEMGPKEFGVRSGKPEKTIIAILNGQSSITPDMAVQFENVTRIPCTFWMNNQRSYDEYIAKEKSKSLIKESSTWAKKFPTAEMSRKGWIPKTTNSLDRTSVLLSFFGVANHTAWENYFFNQKLKVAFRISLSSLKNPYSISAWLRNGEIQASELKSNEYSERKFRETLVRLKSLMSSPPIENFDVIQKLCLDAGVKLVITTGINKISISGSTRWLNNTPLIQISSLNNRNNIFWFTFFHEAAHILLHGKKNVFLEKVEYSDKDFFKEKEADDFARKWID